MNKDEDMQECAKGELATGLAPDTGRAWLDEQ